MRPTTLRPSPTPSTTIATTTTLAPFFNEHKSQIPRPDSNGNSGYVGSFPPVTLGLTPAPPTPTPEAILHDDVLDEIKAYVSNDLRRPRPPQVDPYLVKDLPRCRTCIKELKDPIRLPARTSVSGTPSPPFLRTEAETNYLPERPRSKQLLPSSRFPQLFGAIAVNGGAVKKRETEVDQQMANSLDRKQQVQRGRGGRGGYGTLDEPYTLLNSIINSGVANEFVDLVEDNSRPQTQNGGEDSLIWAAQRHSFDKI